MMRHLQPLAICLALTACGGSGELAQAADLKCAGTSFGNTVYNIRRSLNMTPWGYTPATDQARKGRVSQRFELRPGDCNGTPGWNDCALDRSRTEVIVDPVIMPGQRRWVSWSIYLPPEWQDSREVPTHLGQIHQFRGPRGVMLGLPSNPPLLQFSEDRGSYNMCLHQLSGPADNIQDRCETHTLSTTEAMRGRWTDIIIDLNTHKTTGHLTVMVNGITMVDIKQPVVRYDAENFFVKYGIYRSFISRATEPLKTQVVYFDEVRVGTSLASVDNRCNLTAVD
jgi:hypothetical protein